MGLIAEQKLQVKKAVILKLELNCNHYKREIVFYFYVFVGEGEQHVLLLCHLDPALYVQFSLSSIFIGFREFLKYTDFFPNIWEVSSHKLPIFFSAPPCYSSGIQITHMIDFNHRLYHRSQNVRKVKNILELPFVAQW